MDLYTEKEEYCQNCLGVFMLLSQLILIISKTHSLDLVVCHSDLGHSCFVYLDFTFKHIFTCFLTYLAKMITYVPHLCWHKPSFPFASRWKHWYYQGRLPSLVRKPNRQDSTTKNSPPKSNGKKKEKRPLTSSLDLDSLQLHENLLGTWWHMGCVKACKTLICRILGKGVRAWFILVST